jgi:3-hydroxy-9,10-secoandrosta-1,3,5(10)-triene-9,17-dione monooxygenase reductase component
VATIDPAHYRAVLGAFCSGVTVLTAVDGDGMPLGMTCQSFSALSLDPPLVLVAPARTSTTWPRIRAARGFCVNVLADGQRHVSDGMSRSGTDKFAGVGWTASAHGRPRIAGAAAWIECDVHDEHDGGDHTLVVGAVRELVDGGRLPLLFHRGGYAALLPSRGGIRSGPRPA